MSQPTDTPSTPTNADLDAETIAQIQQLVRHHIVATMLMEDEYGNIVIDMVTGDDE
tara:strand:+ start:189 stop:356 length:168 start_codon:yes stop_codon:yes gene_type:complete